MLALDDSEAASVTFFGMASSCISNDSVAVLSSAAGWDVNLSATAGYSLARRLEVRRGCRPGS